MNKKKSAISSSLPTIEVMATRDSVCAADDIDPPHAKVFTMPGFTNPTDFIREVEARYPLPLISGGKATWTCHLNGAKIGVVAQQWTEPKALTAEISHLSSAEVHFKYHAQASPDDIS